MRKPKWNNKLMTEHGLECRASDSIQQSSYSFFSFKYTTYNPSILDNFKEKECITLKIFYFIFIYLFHLKIFKHIKFARNLQWTSTYILSSFTYCVTFCIISMYTFMHKQVCIFFTNHLRATCRYTTSFLSKYVPH